MPTIYNPNKRKGLFYIPSGAIKSESAAFSYSQDSYRVDESNPTPTITGDTGGTFTATPEGLTLNSSTGEITLSSSVINSYVVTYTLPSGTFENRSLGITAAAFSSTRSFSFDGVDDYFDLGNSSTFNLTTGMTLSAWINPTVAATDKFILAKRWTTPSYQIATAGSINPQCSVWIGSTRYDAIGTTTLAAGTWYHIVGTFDGSNVRVYLNGALETTTAASGSLNQTTDIVSIAKGLNNNSYNFNGKIDQMQ